MEMKGSERDELMIPVSDVLLAAIFGHLRQRMGSDQAEAFGFLSFCPSAVLAMPYLACALDSRLGKNLQPNTDANAMKCKYQLSTVLLSSSGVLGQTLMAGHGPLALKSCIRKLESVHSFERITQRGVMTL